MQSDTGTGKEGKQADGLCTASATAALPYSSVPGLGRAVCSDILDALSVVLGYGSMLLAHEPPGNPSHPMLQQLMEAAEKASDAIRSASRLAPFDFGEAHLFDLNVLLADLLRHVNSRGGMLDVVTSFCMTDLLVRVDSTMLRQQLLSLFDELAQGLREPARVYLATNAVRVGRRIASDGKWAADSYAHVSVLVPCTPANGLAKLISGGTSLSASKSLPQLTALVAGWDGRVMVDDVPDTGVDVRLWLPSQTERADDAVPVELVENAAAGGGEMVLVVEDEPSVREAVSEMLRSLGYSVLTAAGGVEALSFLERYRGPLDLILADVIMPGMRGPEMVRALPPAFSGITVIYTSGSIDTFELKRDDLSRMAAFLEKPYSYEALAKAVRAALAGSA